MGRNFKGLATLAVIGLGTIASVTLSSCGGSSQADSAAVTQSALGAPGAARGAYTTDALIFIGDGTATSEAAVIESILSARGLSYDTVTSSGLGKLSVEDLSQYGVIIWPGGTAKTQWDGISSTARAAVTQAVAERGVSYLGFCAGAFIVGKYSTWGMGLALVDFPYYYLDAQGVTAAMVQTQFASGLSRNLVWYGGPELSLWGQSVAKYPDGTSAVSQRWVGNGLVILSGPHPEAPNEWRTSFGLNDTDGVDTELAGDMIEAALHQSPLAGFR